MGSKIDQHEHRIKELERKVKGMQRQIELGKAQHEQVTKSHDRKLRDLEIRSAVQSGLPQRKVAEIYDLSTGRVSQIVRRVG